MKTTKSDVVPAAIPLCLVKIVAERSIRGVVLVDEKADIVFMNYMLRRYFSLKQKQNCLGENYYTTFFGLDQRKEDEQERIKKTPLWRALKTGKDKKPPYPLIGRGNMAYRVETYVSPLFRPRKGEIRFVLEIWSQMGDKEVFQSDRDFLLI